MLGQLRGPPQLELIRLVLPFPLGAGFGKGDRKAGPGSVPAVLRGLFQRLYVPQGLFHRWGVVFLQQLVLTAQGQRLPEPPGTGGALSGHIVQQQPAPRSILRSGHIVQSPPQLPLFFQPLLRPGVTLDAAKHVQGDLRQAAVIPPRRERIHQTGKVSRRIHLNVLPV